MEYSEDELEEIRSMGRGGSRCQASAASPAQKIDASGVTNQTKNAMAKEMKATTKKTKLSDKIVSSKKRKDGPATKTAKSKTKAAKIKHKPNNADKKAKSRAQKSRQTTKSAKQKRQVMIAPMPMTLSRSWQNAPNVLNRLNQRPRQPNRTQSRSALIALATALTSLRSPCSTSTSAWHLWQRKIQENVS